MENYYKILNISKDAKIEEIKKAYLNELKKYHPDVYKGDMTFAQNKTAQLNLIYSTLKDEEQRKLYDTKLFGINSQLNNHEKMTGIFEQLKNRIKNNFSKYSTNKTKIKKYQKINKKNNNKKEKIIKNDIYNQIEIQEKKERKNLTIMISSIIIGFLLIILFCILF